MTTDEQYLEYILEQLSDLSEIKYRSMIGEYIIYYKDKIIGGLYDNCFLLKPADYLLNLLKNPEMVRPYNGPKEMLLIEDTENKELINKLIISIYSELYEK